MGKRARHWVRFEAGSAMMEMVLILPFLMLLLGLIMFFGWAVQCKQEVIVAARYASWHRTQLGNYPTEADIQQKVLEDRPSMVSLSGSTPRVDTESDLINEVAARNPRSAAYASALFDTVYPEGHGAAVSASFQSTVGFFNRFTGDINDQSSREGEPWRRDDVYSWQTLSDQFYGDLDRGLNQVPDPARGMAQTLRGLFLARW